MSDSLIVAGSKDAQIDRPRAEATRLAYRRPVEDSGFRTCWKCHQSKPLSKFWRKRRGRRGGYLAKSCQACAEQQRIQRLSRERARVPLADTAPGSR